jgi:hypothetical protein
MDPNGRERLGRLQDRFFRVNSRHSATRLPWSSRRTSFSVSRFCSLPSRLGAEVDENVARARAYFVGQPGCLKVEKPSVKGEPLGGRFIDAAFTNTPGWDQAKAVPTRQHALALVTASQGEAAIWLDRRPGHHWAPCALTFSHDEARSSEWSAVAICDAAFDLIPRRLTAGGKEACHAPDNGRKTIRMHGISFLESWHGKTTFQGA